ncbi:small metal-binding protein SmbP [Methylocaldum sp.]|uniref:small metal-binding protein SmbP n=1 Tax=Methylocaldum sp. TaxID=1969727 RepID=UPI002D4A4D8C|nr:small metal-binding protein SmbP [Methylocaldum sp.]HYE34694.1 small metal-binding protein SmbP [Methylocaldum sp.]
MYRNILVCLLAGLTVPALNQALAAEKSGDGAAKYAQSRTETGQSGTGVRGTTGESTGGPGMTGTGRKGDAGTTTPGSMENHVKEALKHAQAAADSGKKGDATGVGEHAQAAKPHVDAAMQQNPNEHLTAAMKSLDSAVQHSQMGHPDMAGKAAEEAVSHLKMAK